MNNEITHINEMLLKVFDNISVETVKNSTRIVEVWKSVLLKIKSYNPNEGQNLVDHSRVVDLKNGMLLIEADHPGWISLLQMHKKFILNGLQMQIKDVPINSIVFRLKNNQTKTPVDFKTHSKNVSVEIEKKIESEEENLQKSGISVQNHQKSYKTEDLSPDLAKIFGDLKKSLLTNSKE